MSYQNRLHLEYVFEKTWWGNSRKIAGKYYNIYTPWGSINTSIPVSCFGRPTRRKLNRRLILYKSCWDWLSGSPVKSCKAVIFLCHHDNNVDRLGSVPPYRQRCFSQQGEGWLFSCLHFPRSLILFFEFVFIVCFLLLSFFRSFFYWQSFHNCDF